MSTYLRQYTLPALLNDRAYTNSNRCQVWKDLLSEEVANFAVAFVLIELLAGTDLEQNCSERKVLGIFT